MPPLDAETGAGDAPADTAELTAGGQRPSPPSTQPQQEPPPAPCPDPPAAPERDASEADINVSVREEVSNLLGVYIFDGDMIRMSADEYCIDLPYATQLFVCIELPGCMALL